MARLICVVAATALASTVSPCVAHAQNYWATKPNRIKIAGALNNWADFCSGTFYFDRRLKMPNEALEPKVNSHFLLSPTPSTEVERWAGWLAYANPDSDVAKPSQERAADALLAARADPSAAAPAEKLFVDTMRNYFQTVYSKCREGSQEPFIADNFYSGDGDFEKAMGEVETNFSQSVKEVDTPAPAKKRR